MFTKHSDTFEAALWDGEYYTYKKLLDEEPNFVGVLDDSTGREILKIFDGEGWVSCSPGEYITKTKNKYGTIVSPYIREEDREI